VDKQILIQLPVYPVGELRHELAELLVLDPLWDQLQLITAIKQIHPSTGQYKNNALVYLARKGKKEKILISINAECKHVVTLVVSVGRTARASARA
jgi:predicted Co/Zn/Cd cation transporter (cation efflux family)